MRPDTVINSNQLPQQPLHDHGISQFYPTCCDPRRIIVSHIICVEITFAPILLKVKKKIHFFFFGLHSTTQSLVQLLYGIVKKFTLKIGSQSHIETSRQFDTVVIFTFDVCAKIGKSHISIAGRHLKIHPFKNVISFYL